MRKGIVFNADILGGGDENRTLRNVDEAIVMNIEILVDTCRILHGVAVVTCLEDDRALIGTALNVRTMLNDIVPILNIL